MTNKNIFASVFSFIAFPIVFCFIFIFMIYILAKPKIPIILSTSKLIFTKTVPNFDKEPVDIFETKKNQELPKDNNVIHLASEDFPAEGDRFGELIIDRVSIDAPLYYDDTEKELLLGLGTSKAAYIPGANSTVLIGGHNNTYFSNLGKTVVGDKIIINTNYGKYVYEITDSRVARFDDTTAYDLYSSTENLILYTCYPFDMLGITPERYFVYAKYLTGPKLDLVY